MSTMQRLTLIGLYNHDNTLFDKLVLPEGYDKQTFIDSLLLEHGEKCVLYASYDFMKFSIGVWGHKWANELERIYAALTEEYNPLHNYDRNEQYTDTVTGEQHSGRKMTDAPKFDVTEESKVDATVEHQISADNSSSYQPESKDISNGGKTITTTDGKTADVDEKINANDKRTVQHYAHIYGNIGVTTSATMAREETELRMNYNLYNAACRIFANELLIGIY